MRLGTLTITGQFPNNLDGLFLSHSAEAKIVFKWTTDGFIRKGRLYKTQDPAHLIQALGVLNSKYSLKSAIA